MSEDNHLARAIAYAMAIAITGTLLLIVSYRRGDERSISGTAAHQRRDRRHAAIAFSNSLAIIGAGCAVLPPGALAEALDRSSAPAVATGSVVWFLMPVRRLVIC